MNALERDHLRGCSSVIVASPVLCFVRRSELEISGNEGRSNKERDVGRQAQLARIWLISLRDSESAVSRRAASTAHPLLRF